MLDAGPAWLDAERVRVFTRPNGDYIEAARVREALARALKQAELPDVRVHDLRHTAATILLAQGKPAKLVQEMLGHSAITLTLDTYSHVTPAMHAEAAATMDALFGRKRAR
jgi:integrase